ncbi:hypothetical protein IFR05_001438 [Cadophora sp. M221]|nr:hypothetical protein IFR05_001438 [Cadophora sp. M221]
MANAIQNLIEEFANNESFVAIDALPESFQPIKDLLRAALNGIEKPIRHLYIKICESEVSELSALALHPHVLLSTVLAVSIAHENRSVVAQLLMIDPPPRPDLRRFLNQPGTAFSTKITATENPELRSLLVRHGYQKYDRHGVTSSKDLYDVLLGKDQNCLDAVSAMLGNGVQPKMDHLRACMRLKPISVLELLLKHYPSEELKDCRLLHDIIERGQTGRVRFLIDVVGINIDMFPTERSGQESGFLNPNGTRTCGPNGTPLHEAVRCNRTAILKMLLEKGARADIKDEDGQTPHEIAKKKGGKEMLALFQEYGKIPGTTSSWRNFFKSH